MPDRLPAALRLAVLAAPLLATALALPGAAEVPESAYSGLHWRLLGPFRGGWATAVAGVPGDPATFYFGGADGGVWATGDAGVTWRPVFDGPTSASIGALAVAPSDPAVIWAGTRQIHQRWDIVAALVLMCSGCAEGTMPTAPDDVARSPQGPAGHAEISGQVYANGPSGEPSLASAVIQVKCDKSAVFTGLTVSDGFYRLSVPLGWVSVTESKDGYASVTSQSILEKDTVLNFGLQPLQ